MKKRFIRKQKIWIGIFMLAYMVQISFVGAFAQDPVMSDFKKVPIPPSPNASALGKFGDIPVSPSTGIPSIQIPIYSYSDNQQNLSLDISLSYHAGGHKVEDMASNVGLGWALRAGGAISRTMKGLPDDAGSGYLDIVTWNTLPLLNTTQFDPYYAEASSSTSTLAGICMGNSPSIFPIIKDIADGRLDGEADIFNISVGEINEKFFFDKNSNPIFITPNNLKVTVVRSGLSILKFIITDGKGVTYHFDILEYTHSDNAIEPSVPSPPMYVSTWYLSKIVSADQMDEIVFTYEETAALYYEAAMTLAFKTEHAANGQVVSSGTTSSYNVTTTYNARRISEINFQDKTKLNFSYSHEREDYTGDKGLTSIKITNGSFEKFFKLGYSYFVSDACTGFCIPSGSPNNWQKRLKLNTIHEESAGDTLPPYQFEYNSTKLPFRSSKDQDGWGFYNGGTLGSTISVPGQIYPPTSSFIGYDRVPSLAHNKAWALEKITYPTGGYTQFTFELNQGVVDNVVKPIGGLRVQKREDFDPVTGATKATVFSYVQVGGTSSGLMITIPTYTAYWNTMLSAEGNRYYFNESLNPTQTLSYFNGSPVIYTRVKEEQVVSGSSNGYKIYEFQPGHVAMTHDNIYPYVQKQDFTWDRGLPTKTLVYNNANVLLSTEENEYQTTTTTPSTSEGATRNLTVGNYSWDNLGTSTKYLYGARYYYLTRGKTQLVKTTNKEYANGQLKQSVTEYTYDNNYYVPKLTKTTNSMGESIEARNYYAFNYNVIPGTLNYLKLMDSLKRQNRVAEIVSTEVWVTKGANSFARSILVNEFALVNTSLVKKNKVFLLESDQLVPLSVIQAFNPGNPVRNPLIKENLAIEKFDPQGRAVDFKLTGKERKSIIWGDNTAFPMASVANASFDDIAFTSFEDSEKGNWVYNNGAPVSDEWPPTGLKVYSVSNGLSRTLDVNKKYTLSFWRNESVSVSNATLSRTGQTVNGWTYEEYLISNTGSISFSGSGKVDEVRLFPIDAQMTSYTFHGANGISSQSDVNGSITRFEYDSLGRLARVRDEKRNIINQTNYNYKTGQ